ncbi:MAG TPA: hypothetical protein VM915_11020 [Verrucomicrobiae bacterium]|jgi:hypothetical protein|nr:hypothetical protein [Verrucomicrobiae bacterium]
MPSQRQTFRNDTSVALEIMVEPNPDRYVLAPKAAIVVEAEYKEGQEPFTVFVYEGGLHIYPAIWPLNVWIDGALAEPDWVSAGPNAVASSTTR